MPRGGELPGSNQSPGRNDTGSSGRLINAKYQQKNMYAGDPKQALNQAQVRKVGDGLPAL